MPQDKVYDERLKAAAAGLPTAAATGYSLLDKMGVTSSEFQQSVTYKRALEGELASTISAMDGVKTAAVRLAIPEKTVFVSKAPDTTASVFVETDAGATLSGDKVQAIVHLTSAAIENLKPANVSVVDSQGNVLSTVGGGTAGSSTKQASDYQQRTSDAVQAVMDRVVGPGNSTVAVAADVTGESAQQKSETFSNADGALPLSESSKTEKYTRNRGRRRRRPRPGQHRCSRRHERQRQLRFLHRNQEQRRQQGHRGPDHPGRRHQAADHLRRRQPGRRRRPEPRVADRTSSPPPPASTPRAATW